MATGIPHGAGLYLAVVQLLFTLGWTVYAIFLPQLADQAGIPRKFVIWILLADQVIFAVMDYAMGVMADRVSQMIGKLGRLMVSLTALSCAAFVALPFVATAGALGSSCAAPSRRISTCCCRSSGSASTWRCSRPAR